MVVAGHRTRNHRRDGAGSWLMVGKGARPMEEGDSCHSRRKDGRPGLFAHGGKGGKVTGE
jgi:hypothetical protein